MKTILILFTLLFLRQPAFAGHTGCVTIYDRALCETQDQYTYMSELVSWQFSKDEFRAKITALLDQVLPDHSARVASFFLWVNDFNSQSALRIQFWSADKSFILDLPVDLNTIHVETDVTVRAAGALPYPIEFGYTLGEMLIMCHEDCTDEHEKWIRAAGVTDMQKILPRLYLLSVPKFNEAKMLEIIKTQTDFDRLFTSIERSPVMEGNGFRELAFTVYL
ncbi:MAG: hypothetical protein JNL11_05885 [Bdellovibrionaceae bacterium]|nr:hypothetical protein [Pseudobdellovibrionaceae bacterium]